MLLGGLSALKANGSGLHCLSVLNQSILPKCVAYKISSEQSHCIEVNETLAALRKYILNHLIKLGRVVLERPYLQKLTDESSILVRDCMLFTPVYDLRVVVI